jgi:alkylation response protein AidB-like acyl-CoA dehydrogenase
MNRITGECVDPPEALRRAGALIPVLRERAALGEKLRRVPDQAIEDMVASKLLRLCQPARFGGSELGWDALCGTLIEMGRGDGSQAWVASVYAAMAYQTALFEDEAQHDVWDGDPDVLIAGSLVPVGNRTEKVASGYRLTGKWPFTSGVHHARWVILGEMGDSGEGKREHLYFLVPSNDLRIDDDWFAVGLSGTGSSTVVLENVFVPAYRMMLNGDVSEGRAPGARLNSYPLYRMPLFGFAQLALASVPVGVAAGMVEDFKVFIRAKSSGPAPASGSDLLQARLSEAAAETRAATLLVVEAARTVMKRLADGARLMDADAAVTLRDSGYALRLAKRAATRIFEATGAHGLYLDSAIQRGFRDVYAAGNHGSLTWERSALRYAQSALKG